MPIDRAAKITPQRTSGWRNAVLFVDLDSALIPSRASHEVFWATISANWRAIFGVTCSAFSSHDRAPRPGPRQGTADLRVDLFPYNPTVLGFVKKQREKGFRIVLVTESDQVVADAVARHLGLFDEVCGGGGREDVVGEAPIVGLANQTFVYLAGKHPNPVLQTSAEKTILAGNFAETETVRQDGATGTEATKSSAVSAKAHLRLMRPHQWIKNALVFLPALLAGQLSLTPLAQSAVAFVIFSLVASGVYVLNDLLDLNTDRAHPRKRARPLASGAVPLEHGSWMALGFFCLGLALAVPLGPAFLLLVAGYITLTTVYSLYLKHKFLLDIATLAGFYTLRVAAGAAATGIPMSGWLLAFSAFFFLSLASVKRQAELVDGPATGRAEGVGHGYVAKDLGLVEAIAMVSGGLSVLVLILYLNTPTAAEVYSKPPVAWGVTTLLLVWLGSIMLAGHRGRIEDDPVLYAVTDWFSWSCLATIVCLVLLGAWA